MCAQNCVSYTKKQIINIFVDLKTIFRMSDIIDMVDFSTLRFKTYAKHNTILQMW